MRKHKEPETTISLALTVLRTRLNLTQWEMADRLGVALATYVRYENAVQVPKTLIVQLALSIAENSNVPEAAELIRAELEERAQNGEKVRAPNVHRYLQRGTLQGSMNHVEMDFSTDERSLLFFCLGIAMGSMPLGDKTSSKIIDLAAKFRKAFEESELRAGYEHKIEEKSEISYD